jgi:hypoxanthine phosphoribosyltransferase
MDKVFFTYQQYGDIVKRLTDQILKDTTVGRIECIYGIPRGGLSIAVHLSHHLNIPYHHVDLNFLDTKQNTVLLVDDISDTGCSLIRYYNALKSMNEHLTILTATLHIKAGTKLVPNFYVDEYDTKFWLVYPWEKEDEETIAGYEKNK